MSRDEQIEKFAKDICVECPFIKCVPCKICHSWIYAEEAFDKGYRKATEVIDEVVELLEELKDDYRLDEDVRAACGVRYAMIKVDELKKKYESESKG